MNSLMNTPNSPFNDPFINELTALHYKCRDLLSAKEYDQMIALMESYKKPESEGKAQLVRDVNELKTILIITKSFKENSVLGPIREEISEIFGNKMDLLDNLEES